MNDWWYAQSDPSQQLARFHYFSMMKRHEGGEVEIKITVKEYVTPKDPAMKFYAEADKQMSKDLGPYRPCGWGQNLLDALMACMTEVNRFPYREQAGAA